MAEEVLRVQDHDYLLASASQIDDRTRVLKHGDCFTIFDRFGDIETFGTGKGGIYYRDTRYLSRFSLKLEGARPQLLSSSIKDDNLLLTVDLMNQALGRDGQVAIPRGTVHLSRTVLLYEEICHQSLRIHNYGRETVELTISIGFDADFVDIFEVRGIPRPQRGRRLLTEIGPDSLLYSYQGLDGRLRRTEVRFDPPPTQLSETEANFHIRLEPHAEASYRCAIACEPQQLAVPASPATGATLAPAYEEAARAAAGERERARADEPRIETSNEQFNHWLARSLADLHMLRTNTPEGPYPYAGVPWYSTVFGRDGIITALQNLWFNPAIARGVLACLAASQADSEIPAQDAQPGKILHETRAGEMAVLGEVPYRRYYGTIDATPLFIVLAEAYFTRTGDRAFLQTLWPHVERALGWIDHYGDVDGDGFVEYARQTPQGLANQGWKDSQDSVFHLDGKLAEGPIALCEVQGYVFAAKRAASRLAEGFGEAGQAQLLSDQAETLRRKFEESFWCEELGCYGLALDGHKQLCRVRSSNAGHCLFSGISSPERALRVATTLTSEPLFSGWGIRTLATGEARYNPMSYHNGTIWPHDNALIAAGFARYGLKQAAAKILTGLMDASQFFDLHRLPELFCGFPRRPGEGPTLYPVACAPQAWASGAVFMLLQACLGLEWQADKPRLLLRDPVLPDFLKEVRILGLRAGAANLDLLLTRHGSDVAVNVLRHEGQIEVVVLK
ncbi:MAG: glycogen debranching N-terminal domain-containing protein [Candidatus Sericytochromatia bacterium]